MSGLSSALQAAARNAAGCCELKHKHEPPCVQSMHELRHCLLTRHGLGGGTQC